MSLHLWKWAIYQYEEFSNCGCLLQEKKKNYEGFKFSPKSLIQELLFNDCSAGIVSIIKLHNRPFYCSLLGDLAFE